MNIDTMKLKHTLKTIGLTSMIACSGVFFTSCDGDGSSSSEEQISSEVLPSDSDGLEAGGAITVNSSEGDTYTLFIRSVTNSEGIATGVGELSSSFTNQQYSDLSFEYDTSGADPLLIIEDNRTNDTDVLAELAILFSDGGAVQSEFDAAVSTDDSTDEQLDAIVLGVADETPNFILDYHDRVFVVRFISIDTGDNTLTVSGSAIEGDEATSLIIDGTDQYVDPIQSVFYVAP